MEYLNLGQAGLRVSRLCLGMMSFGKHESREWALDETAAEPIVRRAVEGGVLRAPQRCSRQNGLLGGLDGRSSAGVRGGRCPVLERPDQPLNRSTGRAKPHQLRV